MSEVSSESELSNNLIYAGLAVLQIGLGALMVHEAGYMESVGLAAIGALLGAAGLFAVLLLAYRDHKQTPEVAA